MFELARFFGLHLKSAGFMKMVKMKTDEEEKISESTGSAPEEETQPAADEAVPGELHQAIWSVVSFEKRLKGGLTYDEAVKTLEKCKKKKMSGLCIITDEAAARIEGS
jgi:hypothetical protein